MSISVSYGAGTLQFTNATGGSISCVSVSHSCYSSNSNYQLNTFPVATMSSGNTSSGHAFQTIVHGPTDVWYVSYLNNEGNLVTGNKAANYTSTYYDNKGVAIINLNHSNFTIEYVSHPAQGKGTSTSWTSSYEQNWIN